MTAPSLLLICFKVDNILYCYDNLGRLYYAFAIGGGRAGAL